MNNPNNGHQGEAPFYTRHIYNKIVKTWLFRSRSPSSSAKLTNSSPAGRCHSAGARGSLPSALLQNDRHKYAAKNPPFTKMLQHDPDINYTGPLVLTRDAAVVVLQLIPQHHQLLELNKN